MHLEHFVSLAIISQLRRDPIWRSIREQPIALVNSTFSAEFYTSLQQTMRKKRAPCPELWADCKTLGDFLFRVFYPSNANGNADSCLQQRELSDWLKHELQNSKETMAFLPYAKEKAALLPYLDLFPDIYRMLANFDELEHALFTNQNAETLRSQLYRLNAEFLPLASDTGLRYYIAPEREQPIDGDTAHFISELALALKKISDKNLETIALVNSGLQNRTEIPGLVKDLVNLLRQAALLGAPNTTLYNEIFSYINTDPVLNNFMSDNANKQLREAFYSVANLLEVTWCDFLWKAYANLLKTTTIDEFLNPDPTHNGGLKTLQDTAEFSNHLASFIQNDILSFVDTNERIAAYERWVRIAYRALLQNNFAAASTIFYAISGNGIEYLNVAEARISETITQYLEELTLLFTPVDGHSPQALQTHLELTADNQLPAITPLLDDIEFLRSHLQSESAKIPQDAPDRAAQLSRIEQKCREGAIHKLRHFVRAKPHLVTEPTITATQPLLQLIASCPLLRNDNPYYMHSQPPQPHPKAAAAATDSSGVHNDREIYAVLSNSQHLRQIMELMQDNPGKRLSFKLITDKSQPGNKVWAFAYANKSKLHFSKDRLVVGKIIHIITAEISELQKKPNRAKKLYNLCNNNAWLQNFLKNERNLNPDSKLIQEYNTHMSLLCSAAGIVELADATSTHRLPFEFTEQQIAAVLPDINTAVPTQILRHYREEIFTNENAQGINLDGRKTMVHIFGPNAYNGPRTGHFLERLESIHATASYRIAHDPSVPNRAEAAKWLARRYRAVTAEIQHHCQIEQRLPSESITIGIIENAALMIRQFVIDVIYKTEPECATEQPSANTIKKMIRKFAEEESQYVARNGRAHHINIFNYQKTSWVSGAIALGTTDNPSTMRNKPKLSNWVLQTFGKLNHRDAYEHAFEIITHSSYPPIALKGPSALATQAMRMVGAYHSVAQNLQSIAQRAYDANPEMFVQSYVKEGQVIALASMMLFSPSQANKQHNDEAAQLQQSYDALKIFHDRAIPFTLQTATGLQVFSLKFDITTMHTPSNSMARSAVVNNNETINHYGFLQFAERGHAFYTEQKTVIKDRKILALSDTIFEDMHTATQAAMSDVEATLKKVKLPTLRARLQKELIAYESASDSAAKIAAENIINKTLQEIAVAEKRILVTSKKYIACRFTAYRSLVAQRQQLLALIADKKPSAHSAEHGLLDFIQLFLEAEELYLTSSYTSVDSANDFPTRFTICQAIMRSVVEDFCQDGEDRTAIAVNHVNQFLIHRGLYGHFPRLACSPQVQKAFDDIAPKVYEFSSCVRVCNNNAPGAAGIMQDADVSLAVSSRLNNSIPWLASGNALAETATTSIYEKGTYKPSASIKLPTSSTFNVFSWFTALATNARTSVFNSAPTSSTSAKPTNPVKRASVVLPAPRAEVSLATDPDADTAIPARDDHFARLSHMYRIPANENLACLHILNPTLRKLVREHEFLATTIASIPVTRIDRFNRYVGVELYAALNDLFQNNIATTYTIVHDQLLAITDDAKRYHTQLEKLTRLSLREFILTYPHAFNIEFLTDDCVNQLNEASNTTQIVERLFAHTLLIPPNPALQRTLTTLLPADNHESDDDFVMLHNSSDSESDSAATSPTISPLAAMSNDDDNDIDDKTTYNKRRRVSRHGDFRADSSSQLFRSQSNIELASLRMASHGSARSDASSPFTTTRSHSVGLTSDRRFGGLLLDDAIDDDTDKLRRTTTYDSTMNPHPSRKGSAPMVDNFLEAEDEQGEPQFTFEDVFPDVSDATKPNPYQTHDLRYLHKTYGHQGRHSFSFVYDSKQNSIAYHRKASLPDSRLTKSETAFIIDSILPIMRNRESGSRNQSLILSGKNQMLLNQTYVIATAMGLAVEFELGAKCTLSDAAKRAASDGVKDDPIFKALRKFVHDELPTISPSWTHPMTTI